jgi:hypothetical protein
MFAIKHALGAVGGVTDWTRIAMLTSAGRFSGAPPL